MHMETLRNGLRVIVDEHAPECTLDTLSVCAWGTEFDVQELDRAQGTPFFGIYHLLEHVFVRDVMKVEGMTYTNAMVFQGALLEDIIDLFFLENGEPRFGSARPRNEIMDYVRSKFETELDSLENEDLFRTNVNNNSINLQLYGRANVNGNRRELLRNLRLSVFTRFVERSWLELTPKDVFIFVRHLNASRRARLEQTFGTALSESNSARSRPKILRASYEFGKTFTMHGQSGVETTTVVVEKPSDPFKLFSYLCMNKNVRLERVVAATADVPREHLVINLNRVIDSPSPRYQILEGFDLHECVVKRIPGSASIAEENIRLFFTFYPECPYLGEMLQRPPSCASALTFYQALRRAVKSKGRYFITRAIDNFEKKLSQALDFMLTTRRSGDIMTFANNYYTYALMMYPLPNPTFLHDYEGLSKAGNYVRKERLAYDLRPIYVDEEKFVIATNCMDNRRLFSRLREYFEHFGRFSNVRPLMMLMTPER